MLLDHDVILAKIIQVLEALKCSTSTRPAIFAMSNPTKNGMLIIVVLFWQKLASLTSFELLWQLNAPLRKHFQFWERTLYLQVEAHLMMWILVCIVTYMLNVSALPSFNIFSFSLVAGAKSIFKRICIGQLTIAQIW